MLVLPTTEAAGGGREGGQGRALGSRRGTREEGVTAVTQHIAVSSEADFAPQRQFQYPVMTKAGQLCACERGVAGI